MTPKQRAQKIKKIRRLCDEIDGLFLDLIMADGEAGIPWDDFVDGHSETESLRELCNFADDNVEPACNPGPAAIIDEVRDPLGERLALELIKSKGV